MSARSSLVKVRSVSKPKLQIPRVSRAFCPALIRKRPGRFQIDVGTRLVSWLTEQVPDSILSQHFANSTLKMLQSRSPRSCVALTST